MGSNKSVSIIIQAYNLNRDGIGTRILKPSVDTRSDKIWSRALGKGIPCEIVSKINVKDFKDDKEHPAIIIDEGQFLTREDVENLATLADEYDKMIDIYGLLADRNQKLFPGSQALLEVGAHFVQMISVKCNVFGCCRDATHHVYFNPDTGLPEFGGGHIKIGSDAFKSVCRQHYRYIRKALLPWEKVR